MKQMLMLCVVGGVCLGLAAPSFAADGAIPIWEPTTISQPGRYVLTRNITSATTTISINSDNVMLDLNGFTVECTGSSTVYGAIGVNADYVTIRNGTIIGAGTAIQLLGTSVTIQGTTIIAGDGGVWAPMSLRYATISHNRIHAGGYGIGQDSLSSPALGIVIHRNFIRGQGGITLSSQSPPEVFRSSEISENIIHCSSIDGGRGINANHGSLIRDNRIDNCPSGGIRVGHRSLVRNNSVSGASLDSGDGRAIEVWGYYNHIEGNLLTDSDTGLFLYGANNVYRGNTARGNSTVDFSDGGTNNTSHGDNYMPNKM